jgi:hypothetical protein
MPIWLPPLLTPIGVIIAACIAVYGYGRQKQLELDKGLIESRRSIYREFISLVPRLSDGTKDTQSKFIQLVSEMNVVATDEVLFAIGEFRKYMTDGNIEQRDGTKIKSLIAEIVLKMRKDCFSASKLDVATTKELLPLS